MNKLEVGKKVFSIHHGDGKANPQNYWLEFEGIVIDVSEKNGKRVEWKKPNDNSLLGNTHYDTTEHRFLKPSKDGFCYYMAELPDMDQYKDGELYKIPTNILKEHMKSYVSPWTS